MPQMGVSVSEGTITKWLKQVGDTVEADESLLEISTDKVDTEVPSPGIGVVQEILVQEGETFSAIVDAVRSPNKGDNDVPIGRFVENDLRVAGGDYLRAEPRSEPRSWPRSRRGTRSGNSHNPSRSSSSHERPLVRHAAMAPGHWPTHLPCSVRSWPAGYVRERFGGRLGPEHENDARTTDWRTSTNHAGSPERYSGVRSRSGSSAMWPPVLRRSRFSSSSG